MVGYLDDSPLALYPSLELVKARDAMSSILVGDDSDGSIHYSGCTEQFVELHGKLVEPDPGAFMIAHIQLVRGR
ncbi:hypothetical protein DF186_17510, partial [Enterococcus hirae]